MAAEEGDFSKEQTLFLSLNTLSLVLLSGESLWSGELEEGLPKNLPFKAASDPGTKITLSSECENMSSARPLGLVNIF